MNPSEIAERAARKLWLVAHGFAPDDGPERLDITIEIVEMMDIVERAIEESQGQPEKRKECPACRYPVGSYDHNKWCGRTGF